MEGAWAPLSLTPFSCFFLCRVWAPVPVISHHTHHPGQTVQAGGRVRAR